MAHSEKCFECKQVHDPEGLCHESTLDPDVVLFKSAVKLEPSTYTQMHQLDDDWKSGNITSTQYANQMIPLIAAREPPGESAAGAIADEKDRRVEAALQPLARMILKRVLVRKTYI